MGKRRDLAGTVLVTILGVWAALLLPNHPVVGGLMAGAAVLSAGVIVYDVAYERGKARSAPTDPSDTRIFTDLTWRQVFRIYQRAGTDAQGQRAVEPFIGMWVRQRGRIRQVIATTTLDGAVLVKLKGMDKLQLWFSGEDDVKRLNVMKPGTRVHVAGRITAVGANLRVQLQDCQLERR